MKRFCALLIATAAAMPLAEGHGGLFRGPSPGLPGKGGPGGPSTGGSPISGGGGGGGPTTGGGGGFYPVKKVRVGNYTDWYTWWKFNREPYLNLRERLGSRFVYTGDGNVSPRPTFDDYEGTVLPTLLKLIGEDDPDVVDSAVLALARVTPQSRAETIYEHLLEALKHDERSVKQSAILALGVLGDSRAIDVLTAIATDSGAGRTALKQKRKCDDVQRGMAAVSLGFLSAEESVPVLIEEFRREKRGNVDVRAAILLALGLFEHGRFEAVRFLGEALTDKKINDIVRSQVPIALSRLGDPARAMVPALVDASRSRRTKEPIRQSAVIALGRLCTPEDREVVDLLTDLASSGNDHATSNFAFVALGRIGALAAAEPARHEAMLEDLDRFLLRQLTKPKRKRAIPFAATACGLVARGYPLDHEARALYGEKLLQTFERTRQPEHRAAIAIGLGLGELTVAGATLLEEWEDSSDRDLKGYLAEAIGLLRFEDAAPQLLDELEDDADSGYRVKVAVALGLMGNRDVSDRLVKELAQARTLWVIASTANAIGRVGDRGAVPGLDKIMNERSRPGLARAFAAVAVGLIAEKTAYPWNTRLSVGANYLAAFPVQAEILDIL